MKVEIKKEDYEELRNNPLVTVDMEARYFIIEIKARDKSEPKEYTGPANGKWRGLDYKRKPNDWVMLRDAQRIRELTPDQQRAYETISGQVDTVPGCTSKSLSHLMAKRLKCNQATASYYIRCLIIAKVLGVLGD